MSCSPRPPSSASSQSHTEAGLVAHDTARVGLVVPVRGGGLGKSRLDVDPARRRALALAFAGDTVQAARSAALVGDLIVVGDLDETPAGVRVIPDPGEGLLAAVAAGLAVLARIAPGPAAVLLGDLPGLSAGDLDHALSAAASHERAFVADAEGSGTVLIVARSATGHAAAFGADSAARHRAAGYVELSVSADSGLRRDVDTLDQLHAAAAHGLGARTAALLES
jgi:2-phospho-L-lactate/phosphoenolpyruvate guanylyltransferase